MSNLKGMEGFEPSTARLHSGCANNQAAPHPFNNSSLACTFGQRESPPLTSENDCIDVDTIKQLAEAIIELGEPDPTTLTHHFASGSYVRELFIPQGTLLVGKVHRYETINILLSGSITITHEDGSTEFMKAPKVYTAPAGSRKAGFAHTDTVWLNVFAAESEDLEAIERKYTMPEVLR